MMKDIPLILIVDDESTNRKVLTWFLAEAGFRTLTAQSGGEGYDMAIEHKPDLIILDIIMPGEDGLAVCARLQNNPVTRDIPVIFISGLSESSDKVRGLETGAVDYVTKPFSGKEVVARARIHLRLTRARQALIDEQAAKLSLLRKAQQALLVSPPEVPGACFAVRYLTVHEAGGDLYDVFGSGEMSHGYFVADVAGHDLGASFLTPALKSLIRQNAGPIYDPAETFSNMNSVLLQVLSPGQLITALYLTINRSTHRARLVRAGHPGVAQVRRNAPPRLLAPEGDVLGCFDAPHYQAMDIKTEHGDRFYLCTDGLLEQPGRAMQEGQTLFLGACGRAATIPLEESLDAVLDELVPDRTSITDDIVLLGVEV